MHVYTFEELHNQDFRKTDNQQNNHNSTENKYKYKWIPV